MLICYVLSNVCCMLPAPACVPHIQYHNTFSGSLGFNAKNYQIMKWSNFTSATGIIVGCDSAVRIATRYVLDGPGIESR